MQDNGHSPRISVLIPSYNTGRFLAGTLDTVVNQTCKDWEVIFMDGGSTDDTMKIVERYAKNYPNIRVISEPDEGPYHAFQEAAKRAKGDFFFLLPISDGYIDMKWFERCIEVFDGDEEISLVWGIPFDMTEEGKLLGPHFAYAQFLQEEHPSKRAGVIKKALGLVFDFLNPKTTLSTLKKFKKENIISAGHMLGSQKPPQKRDWFRYWLKTGRQFPDANMCLTKKVFLECVEPYKLGSKTQGDMMKFYYRFNSRGFLAHCIPVPANFARIHGGQRNEIHRGYNDQNRIEYLERIKTLREKLSGNPQGHTFVNRKGEFVGKLDQ